jgi:uncharacterized radical SAM superfamily Fe-S cluster-containing enzyme
MKHIYDQLCAIIIDWQVGDLKKSLFVTLLSSLVLTGIVYAAVTAGFAAKDYVEEVQEQRLLLVTTLKQHEEQLAFANKKLADQEAAIAFLMAKQEIIKNQVINITDQYMVAISRNDFKKCVTAADIRKGGCYVPAVP